MKKVIERVGILSLFFLISCYNICCFSQEKELKWLSYDEGMKKGKKENLHILIFFNADWCYWCGKMLKEFNRDKRIKNYLSKNFSLISVDVDKETYLVIKYKVIGVPTLWFLQPDGKKISFLNEYPGADNFLDILKYVNEKHYKNITFKEYKRQKRWKK